MGTEEIDYGHVERDLSALVAKRVSDAILSVLQLTETTGQAYLVTISATSTAAAMWSGCFAAHHGDEKGPDMPTALEAIAAVIREKRGATP